ncbi:MAG: heavy-metal-associated domain-containing protein [Candidatus Dojkabacteria bacterium]|nr:heavy-metal-associated domain-containing protein [Candidatus Dojkabacteria bacterium]
MKTHNHIYFVKNIHFASCEILIERKLLEIPNIKFVDVSSDNNSVYVDTR